MQDQRLTCSATYHLQQKDAWEQCSNCRCRTSSTTNTIYTGYNQQSDFRSWI